MYLKTVAALGTALLLTLGSVSVDAANGGGGGGGGGGSISFIAGDSFWPDECRWYGGRIEEGRLKDEVGR